MTVFEGAVLDDARAIMGRYPGEHQRSAIMPLLYLAQSIEGMVSRDGLREIGVLLGITTAEVEAVASFYSMYRLRPTGQHVVNVCTNLSCKLRGAEAVYEAAHEAAGIAHGEELSPDGLFTVHEEECLGVCDFAPAVQVNYCNHDAVTPDGMRDLVAKLRAGDVPPAARGPAFASFKAASRVLAGLQEEPAS
jgi:NADH:ubiquinone oxidoreductase subunit E